MPTLDLTSISTAPRQRKDGQSAIIAKLYVSPRWRKMRKWYLIQHPICEECLKEGRVTVATEVHHKRPIATGEDEAEMTTLAYDYGNIIALCHDCHVNAHKQLGKWKRD